MNYMFYSNYNLVYVNLNNFNTTLVRNMGSMFTSCSSLLYLNLKNFKENSSLSISNMFKSISGKVTYCINNKTAPNIALSIRSFSLLNNCSNICFENNNKFIVSRNICIIENITDFLSSTIIFSDISSSNPFLSDSISSDINLSDSILSDSTFSNSFLTDYLSDSISNNMVLSDSIISESILTDAILSDTILSDSILSNTILTDSILSDTILSDTILTDAILSDTISNDLLLSNSYLSNFDLSASVSSTLISIDSSLLDSGFPNTIIYSTNLKSSISINCEKYINYEQTGCIDYIPEGYYLNNSKLKTIDKCAPIDFYNGICGLNNNPGGDAISSNKEKDNIINIIQNDLLSGNIKSLLNITDGKAKDLKIKKDNVLFTITTSDNQNNNENKNESTIKLGDCENKLRDHYKISDNGTLLIFKMDIYEEGLLIPIIEYEVYNSETNEKLDLSYCKDSKISISIPVNISEDKLFKYNTSSDYYNDICFIYTSDKGTDLSLDDRRNEYSENNQSLCETNCQYNGYYNDTKKALCECEIKINLPLISEIVINRDKLINMADIKKSLNIKVIKCYKLLFSKEGIINNIGNYIILSIILIYIASLIIFIIKGYKKLYNKIKQITKKENNNKCYNRKETCIIDKKDKKKKKKKEEKKNEKNKKEKNKKEKNKEEKSKSNKDINKKTKVNFPPKSKKKEKKNTFLRIKITKTSKENSNSKSNINFLYSNDKIINKEIGVLNNKQTIDLKKNKLYFNDYEMNTFLYKEALKYDIRTYFQYYLSLIRTKHPLIFSFYTYNDYNSKIIKICLFFFSFALYYTVNALFFNDSTMHKIYEDEGVFDIIYQIPQILYSTIICSLVNTAITFFSLTEKKKFEIKKNPSNIEKNLKNLSKYLIIKFSLFYLLSFILLFLFWYYLSCFCAVYRNTQIHLIKDTLISFGLTMIYPFISHLFPGIFRIFSLKKSNREFIYKLSKILQFI